MSDSNRVRSGLVLALVGATLLVGCSDESAEPGRVAVHLTDAPYPFDLIVAAELAIDGVDIRHRPDDGEQEYVALPVQPDTLNLLELANGVTALMGEVDVPAGTVDQVRLIVSHASVELLDGRTFELDVPSGDASGLKIFLEPDVVVPEGGEIDILVDVDVSRSFQSEPAAPQRAEDITGFSFHPVLRVAVSDASGAVSGTIRSDAGTPDVVVDDTPLPRATVSAWQDGESITATMSDANGDWKILGLPPGTVLVRGEAPGHLPDVATVSVPAGGTAEGTDLLLPQP
jgi:hypothetical protein